MIDPNPDTIKTEVSAIPLENEESKELAQIPPQPPVNRDPMGKQLPSTPAASALSSNSNDPHQKSFGEASLLFSSEDQNPEKEAKHTILLVEDDENARFMLSFRLEHDGYQVITASDAKQAITLLSKFTFDLVILDVMMPGMNGLELLYLIRTQYPQTKLPVIMATALDSNDDIVGAFELGANDYITKPINYSVAKARIRSHISQSFSYRKATESVTTNLLGGRYEIQKVLGGGGFSKTYLAVDTQRPGRPLCVVKMLSLGKSKADSPSGFRKGVWALEYSRELFFREAQALEDLGKHPRIPQLLAYFTQAHDFFLVEEYLEGLTLEQKLNSCSTLSFGEAISLLKDILNTLIFIHSKGVIHRDIKPGNIICNEIENQYTYHLIDFGAVKDIDKQYSQNPALTGFIGTKGYAPPEQFIGQTRLNSDIYSLGVVLIESISGLDPQKLNLMSHSPDSVEYKKIQKRIADLLSDYDPQLTSILLKMTELDPNIRYQSAQEVLDALEELGPLQLSP